MKKHFSILLSIILASFAINAQNVSKPVVSILGDSYSTFQDYIPEGNITWYRPNPDKNMTDVSNVRETWWWQLINEGGYILGVNDSYSGSTISYTGYNMDDYRDRSFITRLKRIVPSDILLIFGATNDSWAGVPIGDYVYDNIRLGHLYEFRPALGKLLTEAINRFPGTRIVYIINSELKSEITSSIIEICKKFEIEYVELHDIEKISGHPSISGMKEIKNQVLEALKR